MAENTPAQPLRTFPTPRPPVPLWSRRVVGFPPALPPLVGRAGELAALREMTGLPGCRLVTLTGPGGSGKTRLALALAEEIESEFADGAAFVALAPVPAADLVPQAIARALDLRDTGARPPIETIAAALRDRRVLLVLDNFEHVVAATGEVAALLASCPALSVVVTSRAPLRLHGERQFATPPLALPAASAALPLADLTTYSAVQLFIERARWVSHDFTLHDGNASAVAEICRRLDGLPLAIELAAAWMRVLSPAALLARMEHRLSWLRAGTSDRPARLQTMRNAIAWSHDLLTPDEQRLFRRLAVFVDGFGLGGAEAAWQEESPRADNPPAAIDVLAGLIDKSLVHRVDSHGPDLRFAMLETVREFALERLTASDESATLEATRAAYVLALAERADPEMVGAEHAIWLDRLEAEHANVRAALAWFLAEGNGEGGLRLASALTWFWSSRGFLREARTWLEAFLAMPTSVTTRGRGLLDAANIRHWLGDNDQAAALAYDALAIYRTQDDRYLVMCTLRRIGAIAIDQGDFAGAANALRESRVLLQPTDPAWDFAYVPYQAGRLASAMGQHGEAVAAFDEAAEAFRALGDRGYVAAARSQQGAALLETGDLARARPAFGESLALAIEVRDQAAMARSLAGAAHLAYAAGEVVTATRLLAKASAIREATGEGPLPRSVLQDAMQSSQGSARWADAWNHGATWSDSEAIAAARAILSGASHVPAHNPEAPSNRWSLTRRERDVLRLMGEGRTDKEIGAALQLSRRTVSNHVGAILGKLGVDSRTAAVALALRQGLL